MTRVDVAGGAGAGEAGRGGDFGGRLEAVVGLQRRFRSWAVWVDGTGRWTAARARRYRPGEPLRSPLLWVHAHDHWDLAARMRECRDG